MAQPIAVGNYVENQNVAGKRRVQGDDVSTHLKTPMRGSNVLK